MWTSGLNTGAEVSHADQEPLARRYMRRTRNVLVTVRMEGVRAAQQATATIPIVSAGADAPPRAREGDAVYLARKALA